MARCVFQIRTLRASAALVGLLVYAALSMCSAQAAVVAPDPGGDEDAELFPVPAGKEFGFRGLFHLHDISPRSNAELIEVAGGNAARMPMSWWGLEPSRDTWHENIWAAYDRTYDAMVAAGITPHFTIEGAPPWARDLGLPQLCLDAEFCTYPPARSELHEWDEFVTEVATRFPRATIEIWNEPNFIGAWRSGPDPERYAQLQAHAYDAAKRVDPSIQVLSGGLGESLKPNSLSLREFLDRAYAATPSLKGHMDALNFHTYPGPRLGEDSEFAATLQDVREVRALHGDTATPLYVSETGYTTTGPSAVSQREQSHRLLRTVSKLLSMSDVSGVLVNTLIERPEYPADDHERGFGLLHYSTAEPFRPKVAYCDLVRANGLDHGPCTPIARITSGPAGSWNRTSAEFGFVSGEAGSSFRCSIDEKPFAPCSSPARYDALTEGPHSFRVKATDAGGRVDAEADIREFTVDVTQPDTSLTGPSGAVRDPTVRFQIATPDETAVLECSMDGQPFAPCTSPYLAESLSDGDHVFRARAVDPAGNADGSPATSVLRVDTRAPTVSIDGGPSGATREVRPRFDFSADESGVAFRCGLDAVTPGTDCSAEDGFVPGYSLGHGPHSFVVMATDAAGNRSEVVTRAFDVDVRGPEARILSGPTSPIASTEATFSLAVSEPGAGLECQLDDGAFAPCSQTHRVQGLASGGHWLRVRAVDALGNRGAVAAHSWTVDAWPPQTQITRLSAGATDAVVEFSSPDPDARFSCSLDGRAFTGCTSPHRLADLSPGPHQIRVRATDLAGNVDPTPATQSFSLDDRPPAVTITGGVSGPTTDRRPRFEFSGDEANVTFRCAFDDHPFGVCEEALAHRPATDLGHGTHIFRVQATDTSGNQSPPAVREFAVDLRGPAVAVSGPSDPVNRRDAMLTATPDEPGTTLECSFDEGAFGPCQPITRLSDLRDGRHWFRVRATDALGNLGPLATHAWTIDTRPPDTSVEAGPRRLRQRNRARIRFGSNEAEVSFQCALDGGGFRACAPRHRLPKLPLGRHVLRVFATDRAGNADPTPVAHRIKVR
jgi:hypothetical protein